MGAEPVTVREAGPDEAELLAEVRLRFLTDYRGWVDGPPPGIAEANRAWTVDGLAAGWYRGWLVLDGDELVGGCGLVRNTMPPLPEDLRTAEGWVIAMWVAASHRRRGIARELLDRCRVAAADDGIRRLLLWATPDGAPLYEQAGFTSPAALMHLPI